MSRRTVTREVRREVEVFTCDGCGHEDPEPNSRWMWAGSSVFWRGGESDSSEQLQFCPLCADDLQAAAKLRGSGGVRRLKFLVTP